MHRLTQCADDKSTLLASTPTSAQVIDQVVEICGMAGVDRKEVEFVLRIADACRNGAID